MLPLLLCSLQLSSGALLGSWFAHYKAITSLTVIEGDCVLVSGGEDAIAHAWNIPRYRLKALLTFFTVLIVFIPTGMRF